MATIAVISDVHANLEALEAVLRRLTYEAIYCLGDLVDYGAQPNEVVKLVRSRRITCVLGNHDWAALTGDTSRFNPKAAMSSIWTRKALTEETIEFLSSLPQELKPEPATPSYFTHGSPDDRLWEYVDPRTHSDLFGHYLDKLKVRLIGLGHTHMPYVWKDEKGVVFNPGSVGQPRDGDPRASYAILSIDGGETDVRVNRVAYDVETAAAKIRDAGLPSSHADRLASGT